MDGDVDGLADAISIGIGQASGYAIRSSGGAVAWGHNSNGQLGDGTTMDRAAAVPILIPP